MQFKRVLASLLCAALLFAAIPCTFPTFAEGDRDPMDNYVLATIHEKRALSPMANGYGHGWTRDFSVDVTSVAPENLALSLQFYFVDTNNPEDTSLLSAPSRDLRLTAEATGKNLIWKMDAIKTVEGESLKPGVWNNILVPFTTGAGYNNWDFSSDIISFFWLEFGGMTDPGSYTVRMQNVAIVDTSRPAEVVEEPEWDTTYLVGEIPFTMSATITGNGTATTTAGANKAFAAIDASKHDPKKLQLVMDIEVENLTNPGDVSVLSQISGQIELTSSGKNDVNEIAGGIGSLNWRDGKNEYAVNLATFTGTGGDIDYAAINFMRIYMNGWPASFTDTIKVTVSNVRLVDTTNAASLPTLFGDGMLFQQNKPMNVWGYATEGDAITGKLYKGEELLETVEAVTAASGRWDLAFAAREGSYDSYTIELTQGDKNIGTIHDVVVGELWIAAGQSNMALSVATDMDAADIVAAADDEYLRIFLEPTYPLGNTGDQPIDPAEDIPGAYWGWGNNGAQVAKASAVAYTFAKNLQETLDVPVGIINAAIGGTVIEGWLPRLAVEGDATLKQELMKRGLYYDEAWWSTSAGTMSTLYNQKIGPLAGMNIAGTIWYQGESNSNRSEIYDIELDLLKRSWGEAFGFENGDMPFIFTQVAPYRYDNGNNNQQHLGYLAMYMEKGWALSADKNTAMITIYDLPLDHMKDGASSDPIHPRVKTPVGERFFYSALNMVYGGEEEYTAPVYKSMEIRDNAIYVTFDRVGEGLATTDFSFDVHGFAIAGEDGIYVNAQAELVDEDTVKVWNNRVADPKNVTYAFDNFNQAANLCNSSAIPASPFRTVQVDDTTMNPTVDYFTAQDWMNADADVWVYDTTNTENKNAGVRPSFTVTGGTYSYSPYILAEGTGALRVDFADGATVSPVLSYESIKQDWRHYKNLSVQLLSPDGTDKTVALQVTAGGKTYTVPTVGGTNAATVAASDRFSLVTFDFTAIKDADGQAVSSAVNVLRNMSAMDFVVTGSGTLFMDAFSVGMTDAVVDEDTLNEEAPVATVTREDLAMMIGTTDELEGIITPETLAVYQAAMDAAGKVLDNADATPLQLTDAAVVIFEAILQMEFIPMADFSELEAALEEEITDLSGYTAESAAAYTEAVTAAKALLEKADATQEEIDAAVEALAAATEGLTQITGLLGDVDGDGEITSTDARLTLQYYAKKITADDLNLDVANVDGDDEITSTDARLILQYYAGKIEDFPAEN